MVVFNPLNEVANLMVMGDNRQIPSAWVQSHYGRTIDRQPDPLLSPPGGERSSTGGESTLKTTTATITTNTNTNTNINMHVNAHGGIGKPTKRRSRASRKGPITLFNTDTANFRAMVQQYTGAPTVAISSGSQPGPPTINFGFGGHGHGHGLGPYQGMMVPPSQTHPTLQQLQQQLVFQRGGESLFSLGNNNRASADMGISDGFLEGLPSYGQPQTSNDHNNGLHFTREDRFRSQY